jgi:hypothetical protein
MGELSEMVTTEELVASLTTTYDVAVVAAFVELSHGKAAMGVLRALYELAQERVVEDPERFGLAGGRP